VLGAVNEAGKIEVRVAGDAALVPERVAATRETIFDLASLTKVIFTTTEILRLVDEGRIALDDPLAKAIPDLRQYDVANAPERKLTFRQCLAHQTHLPAVEPIYTLGRDPATLKAYVLQNPWRAGPPVYSDINFILLGIAIERLRGRVLAELALPQGLTFRPDPSRCAAAERCAWRERVMRGQVHDENAFALGGVAGHAGLFGAIDGVLGFAHGLLAGTVLKAESIAALRARNAPTRTLGWEIRHEGWHGGAACSDETIGHTGFTGTGLWIDWHRRVAWALLTNRVHPTRHVETGIQELRRSVGERLISAL
jgi:CubicO group peptidase (beta-lactamase class C family)